MYSAGGCPPSAQTRCLTGDKVFGQLALALGMDPDMAVNRQGCGYRIGLQVRRPAFDQRNLPLMDRIRDPAISRIFSRRVLTSGQRSRPNSSPPFAGRQIAQLFGVADPGHSHER